MAVAYETKDQEDEHSCFSDNTNADVMGDQVGIRRVYLGELPDGTSVDTSISTLVAKVDPKLDARAHRAARHRGRGHRGVPGAVRGAHRRR